MLFRKKISKEDRIRSKATAILIKSLSKVANRDRFSVIVEDVAYDPDAEVEFYEYKVRIIFDNRLYTYRGFTYGDEAFDLGFHVFNQFLLENFVIADRKQDVRHCRCYRYKSDLEVKGE